MIEVKNLVKKYGDFKAVDDISFNIGKGEIVGFLGPNGAGKTTTIRMLTGFSPATSGQAYVNGFEVFEKPMEVKKSIGYLPEFPPVYPDLTVRDYLSFVAEIKGIEKKLKKERIDYVTQKCGLSEVIDKEISKLSKGFKQRVGIAQALIHNPLILFLDEPTSGLDPIQIIEVRNLIRELRNEHTIFLSSHILPEVSALCDKVIIIANGKIMAVDTPERLSTGMSGQKTFTFNFLDDISKAENIISQFENINNIKVVENSLEVKVNDISDIPLIVRRAVENRLDITGVIPKTASLEEVFLHLTTKEGA
ncbi:MAG: ABC transporter ATP-binding protein [Candidatus Muirbacterium halophilum]|nr:ABC transporter ATP-binding protein [Candidatus Muirbacterium halophilum]MCK9475107.1 ABC transporter ATP-binding protein [Candidatus Muirbacterium halophilum]